MRREEALRRLRAARPEWKRLGVAHLAIFGSLARDEARAGSDIDILVELPRLRGFLNCSGFGASSKSCGGREWISADQARFGQSSARRFWRRRSVSPRDGQHPLLEMKGRDSRQ